MKIMKTVLLSVTLVAAAVPATALACGPDPDAVKKPVVVRPVAAKPAPQPTVSPRLRALLESLLGASTSTALPGERVVFIRNVF
jgi:hypothetical protein